MVPECFQELVSGSTFFARGVEPHRSGTRSVFLDMKDALPSGWVGEPLHECSVGLLDRTFHELITEMCLGSSISGEQDHPRCFLVEAMNDVRARSVGVLFFPVVPEQVDETQSAGIPSLTDCAEPGGFCHRAKVRILVQDLQ